MKVSLSAQAEQDLVQIGLWIARHDRSRAISFIQELRRTCAKIGEAPRGYPAAPLFGPHTRRRTHGNYVIIYDVEAAHIVILTIVHGARDIERLLGTAGTTPLLDD